MAVFSFTEDKYKKVLARVAALETHHNDIAVAMDQFITRAQVQEFLILVQTKLDDYEQRLDSLEERLTAIEEEPLD